MDRGARRLLRASVAGAIALGVLIVAVIFAAPHAVRTLLIVRLQALTGRTATIDGLDLDLRRGTLALRGVRLTDPDGETFATIERLDARITLSAVLVGHLWI